MLAHKEWMEIAFGAEVDQRDLLFQSVARLERTARKAEGGQFAVVVGYVAQLNKMMALGADQKGFEVTQATTTGADTRLSTERSRHSKNTVTNCDSEQLRDC